LNVLALRFCI